MKPIDKYSFLCGTIDCFNEMVYAGLKQMALSHPTPSMDTINEFLPYSKIACEKYGTKLFIEEEIITTDLFPTAMTKGMKVILYYKNDETLEKYKNLKAKKADLIANNTYSDKARYDIAYGFGKLLSYPDHEIDEHIAEHSDKE